MSTAALANIRVVAVGDRLHARARVTQSGTYAAGGSVITALSLGLRFIEQVFLSPPDTAGYHVAWDQVTGASIKVKTYDEDNISGVEAEVSGTVTHVYSILVIGV